jgi:hypothetical protein
VDEMGDDDDDDVVFLDDEEIDDADWIDEEGLGSAGHPGMLPPRVSRHRLLVTLAALAVFLGGTGAVFTAAYHRHMTDLRIANLLDLAAAASPQIPGLADLGFSTIWHAEVRERVVVPVVNQGPRPVVLLGAVLSEPGMISTADLKPTGEKTLRTGEVGDLAGEITVSCAQAATAPFAVTGNDPSASAPRLTTPTLRVQAKTASGTIAQATLNPESGQALSGEIQQRICTQQGAFVVGGAQQITHYDRSTHILTFTWSATSRADSPLWYDATLELSVPGRDAEAPCTAETISPAGEPYIGTLKPGATIRATFEIQMSSCQSGTSPPDDEALYLSLQLAIDGTSVLTELNTYPVELS